VLGFEPAGAETEDEPAAGGMVHDSGRLGHHGRVPEGHRQHGVPDPLARHVMDQRGHRREGFPRSAGSGAIDVGQVVVHPDGLEDVVFADPRPGGIKGRPVDRLRRCLDPD
jgi:hypothetical protein